MIISKHKIIGEIREMLPLRIRIAIGPFIGYLSYLDNYYLKKNRYSPKVLSIEQTLDLIIEKKLSVVRFGDGEVMQIENIDLPFQEAGNELAEKLKNVLQVDVDGFLVCIPGIWKKLDMFTKRSYWFAIHHLFRYRHVWYGLLSQKQIYGDAFISRPYLGYKDKSNCGLIFKKLFSIWEDREVVLIEGEKSRLGVGNDMFDNVRSIQRILCPAENAYARYEEIKNEAKKISKDKLVLLSLGPAAKILAYDLFLQGYRVIDIGHIDMEYEMFLKNSEELVKVEGKYFNEIDERNPADCRDEKYLSQIIAKIV